MSYRQIMDDEVVDITVRHIPADKLRRLVRMAQQNGVGTSKSDAMRWAGIQFLDILESKMGSRQVSAGAVAADVVR